MAAEIPPHVQNQLVQLQQLREQAQVVIAQRQQLEAAASETERTVEALKKADPTANVYRGVGSVLVQVKDRDTLVKELEEEKETLDVRLQSAKRNETRLKERMTALQQEIQAALGGR